MVSRKWMAAALVCAAVSATLFGCFSAKEFVLSGMVEYTQYDIHAQAQGMIVSVAKAEGETVREGDVVASIDPQVQQTSVAQLEALVRGKETRLEELKSGSRKEVIAQAEAALKAAKANYSNLKNGSTEDQINQAQAAADAAEANEDTAKVAYDYAKGKYDEAAAAFSGGLITQDAMNDAKYAMDTAYTKYQAAIGQHKVAQSQLSQVQHGATQEAINAAQAAVDQAQANLNMTKNGNTSYVIGEAQADLDAANAQLDQAKLMLARCEIKASASGVLSLFNTKKGDMVNAGGYVATILDPNDLWMHVYVPQSKLKYVSQGQNVSLTTSAYVGETFSGTVVTIANEAEFTPKNIETNEAKENTVFKVKIRISDSAHKLKSGMTMDAAFALE